MVIDSKYTKSFRSHNLTQLKYNELRNFAIQLREHKNTVSQLVNSNLLNYLDYTKFSFVKEMRNTYKGSVASSFDAQLYTQIFTCYQNKFAVIKHKLNFQVRIFKGFEHYKRNTSKHKKGDLKTVLNITKTTPLSICLTYLAKYGNGDTLDYIKSQLSNCDEKKKKFYEGILNCCEKFGFERIYALALDKRKRIIEHYSETPIEFKSLTFSGRCRKKKIIDYNKHYNSKLKSFISLSGLGRVSFDVPVKFNKGWHGNIKEYENGGYNYEYILTFDESWHQINIHICKEGKRFIPHAHGKVVGIDVNCKHNLFSLSNDTIYDYDRKLVNDFCKLSLQVDDLKSKDKDYKVGKRKQRKLNVLKSKMIKSEQQMIAIMCKRLREEGVGHLVMENLDNGFGKCYVKDKENDDINFNRKVKFLGISSLKNEVEHIARNYDIALSIVHASYTSKMCSVCGCIDDGNRPTQEEFKCVECGHEDNADFNASKNIRDRVLVTVLRDKLLKQLDNGAYEPKALKRDEVKKVLLLFRRSLQKIGSECVEGSLSTFDHV